MSSNQPPNSSLQWFRPHGHTEFADGLSYLCAWKLLDGRWGYMTGLVDPDEYGSWTLHTGNGLTDIDDFEWVALLDDAMQAGDGQ